jgi:hypothetical protein
MEQGHEEDVELLERDILTFVHNLSFGSNFRILWR